jgi:hypothetical protein
MTDRGSITENAELFKEKRLTKDKDYRFFGKYFHEVPGKTRPRQQRGTRPKPQTRKNPQEHAKNREISGNRKNTRNTRKHD